MNNKKNDPESPAHLRWRAEEFARHQRAESASESQPLSPEETRRTIHELRVHQIELKMQNEELRRIQAELDTARAHYYDLYDLAPVGYCILSVEGLILEANSTAVKLLEAARSTLIRQPITRFIHKEDQDIYYLHRKRLFESNEPQACELRMVKKDGTTFWARLSATPPSSVRDTDGAPASRLVLSDITERKRVEEENAELLAQLQKIQDARQTSQVPRLRGGGKIA
jgi:PAS domain S-box-containing protein